MSIYHVRTMFVRVRLVDECTSILYNYLIFFQYTPAQFSGLRLLLLFTLLKIVMSQLQMFLLNRNLSSSISLQIFSSFRLAFISFYKQSSVSFIINIALSDFSISYNIFPYWKPIFKRPTWLELYRFVATFIQYSNYWIALSIYPF